jgi:hypothetical protein
MFIGNILNFQVYGDLNKNQISFAKGLAFIEETVRKNIFNHEVEYSSLYAVNLQDKVGIVVLALTVLFLIINKHAVPKIQILFMLIVSITLAPGTVWDYYSIIFISFSAIIILGANQKWNIDSVFFNTIKPRLNLVLNCSFIFALSVSFIRLPFNVPLNQDSEVIQTSSVFIPIVWLTYIVFSNMAVLTFLRNRVSV